MAARGAGGFWDRRARERAIARAVLWGTKGPEGPRFILFCNQLSSGRSLAAQAICGRE